MGAVIMKMISSTNMTSANGVMLISALTVPGSLFAPAIAQPSVVRFAAGARTRDEEVVQVVREVVEAGQRQAVGTGKEVVRQHGRNGSHQTQGGHVQRLADRAGHGDRKSTRLNSSHVAISYAVF